VIGYAAGHLTDAQIATIRRRLLRWGRANFKDYPWRAESDPWRSLLAEFLLQRTRASQVEAVFSTLVERFPTAESLATAGLPGVEEITRSLGLHRRGQLLLATAKTIAERGGYPPDNVAELRSLAGVGMYTAAAWLSLHKGKRATIVDSNVVRWLSRMTGFPYDRDPRHSTWVKDLAERLTPRRAFRDFNYAVLDFAMNICRPRTPRCPSCPLSSECRYGAGGVP
jgi:A/G-specific adenine glycosylase